MAIPLLQPIPERHRAACHYCDGELDVRDRGVYQWTSGWVMNRDGGGGHGISLPERLNRWAHQICVERAIKGQLNQRMLFAEAE